MFSMTSSMPTAAVKSKTSGRHAEDHQLNPSANLPKISSFLILVSGFGLFIILHFVVWWMGYRENIDLQYYPAYLESAKGGWLCLASMDSLAIADASKPYSGWPILFGFLLGIPSKLGIPYGAGVALTNATIGLATARSLYLLLRSSHPQISGILFLTVTCLAGAYWSSATMAFAHRLIPLGMLIGCLSWVRWRHLETRANALWRSISAVFAAGLLVGSMNWACYFIAPAIGLVSLLVWRKGRDRTQFFRDITWCFVFGFGLILAFVIFKIFHSAALHDTGALAPPLSGDSSRIRDRMLPSPRDVFATGFFAVLRSSWAILPLLPLVRWRKFSVKNILHREDCQIGLVLVLACVSYITLFSGEMAMAAHRFYIILFLAPAAAVFVILFQEASTVRRWLALGLTLFTAAFSLFGYTLFPLNFFSSPRQASWDVGFVNPREEAGFVLGPETYNLTSVTRTAFRQWTLPPFLDEKRVPYVIGNKQFEWFHAAAPTIGRICPADGLVIGCCADLSVAPFASQRDMLPIRELEKLEEYLNRLKTQVHQGRIVLAMEKGPIPAAVGVILSRLSYETGESTSFRNVDFHLLRQSSPLPPN
jgi:hypothetical protein